MPARCAHCHASAVVRPSAFWRIAHVAAWGYVVASVFGASLFGPLIVVLLPGLFLGGMCLVGETHRRASEPPACGACGRIAGAAPERDAIAFAPVARAHEA